MIRRLAILLFILLVSCYQHDSISRFIGFWEGPHPFEADKKFYIQIEISNDSLTAKGYWTKNKFYESGFNVSQPQINGDSLKMFIPGWNCVYSGIISPEGIIGGFYCKGEPFDKVPLVKNDEIENYLIYPKPGCKNVDFLYKYTIPASSDDKIETSRYLSANDSLFICSIIPEIISGAYGRLNSFLLFKNSKLICEEYFYGYSQNDIHQIESCTKSVTSLLIGVAVDKNRITDINESIYNIFPEYSHLKNKDYNIIAITHLLSMTSGFDPQNDRLYKSENRIDFALKRELRYQPGTTFQYDGGNTELLGAILKAKTGIFADEFAKRYLFEPLAIRNYNWDTFRQEGYPSMGGSLQLLPRDMLKIGVLVLNKGWFNNQQVVSGQWIRESTSVKTKTHIPGDDYSYQWWNLNLQSNGKNYHTIWANGWGSQFIYIFPEINVVIATTGHNYENDSWAITEGVRKYIHLLDTTTKLKK